MGSSRISSSGSWKAARISPIFCRLPRESSPNGRSRSARKRRASSSARSKPSHAAQPRQQAQRFAAAGLAPVAEVAGQVAEPGPDRDALAAAVEAEQPGAAAGRVDQVEQGPDRRRLARPVGPEEAEHLAGFDAELTSSIPRRSRRAWSGARSRSRAWGACFQPRRRREWGRPHAIGAVFCGSVARQARLAWVRERVPADPGRVCGHRARPRRGGARSHALARQRRRDVRRHRARRGGEGPGGAGALAPRRPDRPRLDPPGAGRPRGARRHGRKAARTGSLRGRRRPARARPARRRRGARVAAASARAPRMRGCA